MTNAYQLGKTSILRKKANKKRQRVRAEGTVGAPAPKKQSDCPQTGPKVRRVVRA